MSINLPNNDTMGLGFNEAVLVIYLLRCRDEDAPVDADPLVLARYLIGKLWRAYPDRCFETIDGNPAGAELIGRGANSPPDWAT